MKALNILLESFQNENMMDFNKKKGDWRGHWGYHWQDPFAVVVRIAEADIDCKDVDIDMREELDVAVVFNDQEQEEDDDDEGFEIRDESDTIDSF